MRVAGEILMLIGAAWSLLAAIGVNRFGDTFARMHAATKSTTLGLLFVLAGAALHLPLPSAAKLLLAGLLLLFTAPVGAHLVGRAVLANTGRAVVHIDTVDELRDPETPDA